MFSVGQSIVSCKLSVSNISADSLNRKILPSEAISNYHDSLLSMKEVNCPVNINDDDEEVSFFAFGPLKDTSNDTTINSSNPSDEEIVNPTSELPQQIMRDDR